MMIEQLPLELIQAVLAAIPDIFSLESAVLTGPCLLFAFKSTEDQITKAVLLRHIHEDLLHDALALAETTRRWQYTLEKAAAFLHWYFPLDQQQFHPELQWKLSQALRLARLHRNVEFFVGHIASRILGQHATSNHPGGPMSSVRALSCSEANRIARSLYRFEVFCQLFQDHGDSPFYGQEDPRLKYFSQFAPWENEQLACIHDYLLTIMRPVFEELVQNDPDWVIFFAGAGNGLDKDCEQFHLSLGLNHIRQLAEADTTEKRRNLLAAPWYKQGESFFLSEAITPSVWVRQQILANLSTEEEEYYIPKPQYRDLDCGPEDIWRWAHRLEPPHRFVFSLAQASLRRWAYVMWDRSRLDDWGVFESSWDASLERHKSVSQKISQMSQWQRTIAARAKAMAEEGKLPGVTVI